MRRLFLVCSAICLFAVPAWATWYYALGVAADETAPTVQSSTIGTSGEQLTVVFDEPVTGGSGSTGTLSVGGRTWSYAEGDGTDTLVFDITPHVPTGTITWSYTQPGGGIRDLAGNDLATVTTEAITNSAKWDISEGFEGTGAPTGWSVQSSNVDWDDTTSPIVGGQSMLLTNAANNRARFTGYSSTEYVAGKFTLSSAPDSNTTFIAFTDSSDNILGQLQYRSNGVVAVISAGGSLSGDSTISLMGTVWWKGRYTEGTGSNAITEFWLSDDGVTFDDALSSTNGTSTATVARMTYRNTTSLTISAVRFDSIKKDAANIDISEIE